MSHQPNPQGRTLAMEVKLIRKAFQRILRHDDSPEQRYNAVREVGKIVSAEELKLTLAQFMAHYEADKLREGMECKL